MITTTLNAKLLKRAILAGSHKVITSRENLNKINVFPVPDGDTGSNMAAAFESISKAVIDAEHEDIRKLAESIADAAMNGARGNSGTIIAQFFISSSNGIKAVPQVGIEEFADIVSRAASSVREAIANPVEGTIITVMDDWGCWIRDNHMHYSSFEELICESLNAANESLNRTPQQLEALSKANVVDAGAQGFVNFLQGIHDAIDAGPAYNETLEEFKNAFIKPIFNIKQQKPLQESNNDLDLDFSPHESHDAEIDFQFCTECIIYGDKLDVAQTREELSDWGNSLIAIGNKQKLKIHIHTNDPERVFQLMGRKGEILATKADDMWAQYRACMDWSSSKEIALITDSSCTIPQEYVAKYNIIIVPLQVIINNEAYLDRVNISAEKFINDYLNSENNFSTSQPLQPDLQAAFNKASRQARAAIGLFLSSGLSGTMHNVKAAADKRSDCDISIIDSKQVASGLGMVVQIAAEAIHARLPLEEVKRRVDVAVKNTRLFISVSTLEYLIKGGRVSKKAGRFAKSLGLLPILASTQKGTIEKFALSLGKKLNRRKTLAQVIKYAKKLQNPRFIICHAEAEAEAKHMAAKLAKKFKLDDVPVLLSPPVILAHSGPGSIGISVFGHHKDEMAF